MLVNLWLAYRVFSADGRIAGDRRDCSAAVGLSTASSDYLYYNGGSMYDVFCFLFVSRRLRFICGPATEGRLLGVWETIGFLRCFICALNSKEMAVALPVMVLIYELLWHPPDFRKLARAPALVPRGRANGAARRIVRVDLPSRQAGIPRDRAEVDAYVPVYTWAAGSRTPGHSWATCSIVTILIRGAERNAA